MKCFKSITSLFIITLTLGILVGCNSGDASKEAVVVTDSETVNELFEQDGDFLFVLGATTCSYCIEYKEKTLPYYTNDIYPLVFSFSDQSFTRTALVQLMTDYQLVYQYSPTTYLVKDGVVVAQEVGYMSLKDLNKFISAND